MAEELIQVKMVYGLMVAVGNLDHVVRQKYSSMSLPVTMVIHGSRMAPYTRIFF